MIVMETQVKDPLQIHWSQCMYECTFQRTSTGYYNLCIEGGSEFGSFIILGSIFTKPKIGVAYPGDIILEINHRPISGCTQADTVSLIEITTDELRLTLTRSNSVPGLCIRSYLSKSFSKGSPDQFLQETIRDNLYMKVFSLTTAPSSSLPSSRIKTISYDEFCILEETGELLEVGYYDGHLYGTPKPHKNGLQNLSIPSSLASLAQLSNQSRMQSQRTLNGIETTDFAHDDQQAIMSNLKPKNTIAVASVTQPPIASIHHGDLLGNMSLGNSSASVSGTSAIDQLSTNSHQSTWDSSKIVLRHYAVWLTKEGCGFGMKILSVEDKHGIFTRKGEPLIKGFPILQLRDVVPNGPAYNSGIMRKGDVFLKIDETELKNIRHRDIKQLLSNFSVGQTVKFLMSRAVLAKAAKTSLSQSAYFEACRRSKGALTLSKMPSFKHNMNDSLSDSTEGMRSHNSLSTTSLVFSPFLLPSVSGHSSNLDGMMSISHEPIPTCLSNGIDTSCYDWDAKEGQNSGSVDITVKIRRTTCIGYPFSASVLTLDARPTLALVVAHTEPNCGLNQGDLILSVNQVDVTLSSRKALVDIMTEMFGLESLSLGIRRYPTLDNTSNDLRHMILQEVQTVEDYKRDGRIQYACIIKVKPVGYGLVLHMKGERHLPQIKRVLEEKKAGLENVCSEGDYLFSINGTVTHSMSSQEINDVFRKRKPSLQVAFLRKDPHLINGHVH